MAAESSYASNGTSALFLFCSGKQGYQSLAKSFTDIAHANDRLGSSTCINTFGKFIYECSHSFSLMYQNLPKHLLSLRWKKTESRF